MGILTFLGIHIEDISEDINDALLLYPKIKCFSCRKKGRKKENPSILRKRPIKLAKSLELTIPAEIWQRCTCSTADDSSMAVAGAFQGFVMIIFI